jgi:hypothetical protein
VTATFLEATAGIVDPELTIEKVRDGLGAILDRSGGRLVTDPTNPFGEPNDMVAIMVRKPYPA